MGSHSVTCHLTQVNTPHMRSLKTYTDDWWIKHRVHYKTHAAKSLIRMPVRSFNVELMCDWRVSKLPKLDQPTNKLKSLQIILMGLVSQTKPNNIALIIVLYLTATEYHLPYGITVLPSTWHKWTHPTLTPARRAGTWFASQTSVVYPPTAQRLWEGDEHPTYTPEGHGQRYLFYSKGVGSIVEKFVGLSPKRQSCLGACCPSPSAHSVPATYSCLLYISPSPRD